MPVACGRIIFSGTLAGGSDIWTTGHSCTALTGKSQGQLDAIAAQCADLWDIEVWTPLATVSDYVPVQVVWTSVRVEDFNGTSVVRTATHDVNSPQPGQGVTSLPPQCSGVISLRTGQPGGRRRGRMYFPPFAATVLDAYGTFIFAARNALADSLSQYFTAFNGDATVESTAVVASQTGGFLSEIVEVRVGNIIDTQRRRRNTLPESYYQVGVTT